MGEGRTKMNAAEVLSNDTLPIATLRLPGEAARALGRRYFTITGPTNDQSVYAQVAAYGFYEPGIMHVLAARLRRGDWMIDAGANIGLHTLVGAAAVGRSGGVLAFEASPTNAAYLEANLRRNGVSNVGVVVAALWDRVETRTLSFVPGMAGCSFLSATGVAEGVSQAVECRPLDDMVPEWMNVRLIKIDVEGAEIRVLDGARRILQRSKPDLIVEVNPTTLRRFFAADWRELTARLDAAGYAAHIILNDNRLVALERFEDLDAIFARGHDLVNLFCVPR